MSNHIEFHALKAEQIDLVTTWLRLPHVSKWYHGEGLQNTLKGLKNFVNRTDPHFDAWVGYYDETPFAFVMSYGLDQDDRNDPDCHQAKWLESGKPTIGIDLLIGDTAYLGKGLSGPLITSFLDQVHPKDELVFIDPEATNTKAIHVYEKVGFEVIDDFIASWHPVPHKLMRLRRK